MDYWFGLCEAKFSRVDQVKYVEHRVIYPAKANSLMTEQIFKYFRGSKTFKTKFKHETSPSYRTFFRGVFLALSNINNAVFLHR